MVAATLRSDPTRARRLHGRATLAQAREPKKRPTLWLRELDDGAAYSSDGVPSLPSSPVWAHAEQLAPQPTPQHGVAEMRLFPSHTGPPSVPPRAHPLSMEYADRLRHPCKQSMSSFTMSAISSRRSSHSHDVADMNVPDIEPCHQSYLLRDASVSESGRILPADVLHVGDRIGPGMHHDGEFVHVAQSSEGFSEQDLHPFLKCLEVVKLLGRGSYAVVYLAREVGVDGGEYALKCLSKRDLSPDQLADQRLEATIHQLLPPHKNIVTLHNTYETRDWLFLVLEYCPGKDMFYWLEEASESIGITSATHIGGDSVDTASARCEDGHAAAFEIASKLRLSHLLLATPRLQLISHIFGQMCDAVQFCHDHGVSHRDIKPENLIVQDQWQTDGHDSVVVKLTDFGLATTSEFSNEFNCGSNPYMAFECRHDLASTYDPKQADTWSLGIVLLNLLFLRSPFSQPSAQHCASFLAFSLRPVAFLMQAFQGLTVEVTRFLCEHVFCNVTHGERRRITPREFGQWAQHLPQMLGCHVPLAGASVTRPPAQPLRSATFVCSSDPAPVKPAPLVSNRSHPILPLGHGSEHPSPPPR